MVGVFCFTFIKAQFNLVPNPSFEDSISIPQSHGQLNKCKNWYVVTGSPDYFSTFSPTSAPFPFPSGWSVHVPNNCFGFQYSRTGNFHSGIYLRSYGSSSLPPYFMGREVIGIKLIQPLVANHSYSFTMYYSLSDASGMTTNQLTAFFSVNQFTLGSLLTDTNSYKNYLNTQISHDASFITDTANWVPLTGCFIAEGGEEYMTIGNFKDALHSPTIAVNSNNAFDGCGDSKPLAAYIYVDDVSLFDVGLYLPATCKNDTLICNGTSLAIANNFKDSSIVAWSPTTALSCTNCVNPIASPTTATLYYLNKSICGASSKDSILIQVHTPTTTANAGNDKTICIGEYTQIGTTDSLAFTNYLWQNSASLSCTNCAMPFANPNVTTTYTVQRTECTNVTIDTVKIIIDDCDPTFVLPNVFTPNGDEINDTWGINFSTVNSHIKDFKMSIYDRWGLLVYSTNPEASTPKSKWDGRTTAGIECNAGVYFYVITFSKNDEEQKLTGHLSLFR